MDINKLTVGQKVTVRSGPFFKEGTVIKVDEDCISVEFENSPKHDRCWTDFRYDGTQSCTWELDGCW
jgi:hypothetical protein